MSFAIAGIEADGGKRWISTRVEPGLAQGRCGVARFLGLAGFGIVLQQQAKATELSFMAVVIALAVLEALG
ncbi:hypothetical protein D3C81_1407830 [compost metagenome]